MSDKHDILYDDNLAFYSVCEEIAEAEIGYDRRYPKNDTILNYFPAVCLLCYATVEKVFICVL